LFLFGGILLILSSGPFLTADASLFAHTGHVALCKSAYIVMVPNVVSGYVSLVRTASVFHFRKALCLHLQGMAMESGRKAGDVLERQVKLMGKLPAATVPILVHTALFLGLANIT
jgi:hypothetical protein